MLNDDEEELLMQEWSLGDYDNGENGCRIVAVIVMYLPEWKTQM
ncbi:hypothetical protein [Escherichia coli]|nr:hypothetical protein [Escherichia coli]EFZ71969.1 hypothetical protein ECOK1357_0004 [Escherichia coli OK1357]